MSFMNFNNGIIQNNQKSEPININTNDQLNNNIGSFGSFGSNSFKITLGSLGSDINNSFDNILNKVKGPKINDFNDLNKDSNRDKDREELEEINRILNGTNASNNNKKNKKQLVQRGCTNPVCDHLDYSDNPDNKSTPMINVNTIDDLITIGKTYHCKKNTSFNGVSLKILCDLIGPLTELQNMVGMAIVKENMFNQIIFFLQGLNRKESCTKCTECLHGLPCMKTQNDMLHTVITGSPGCGKTELGKILGKVYKALGILETGSFRIVTRSDMIGKYLGHTAIKTQEVIDSCRGGVMFIDEAYALGHAEGRDSFSKECLDTLNQNLSEHRDFLCIIAGYKSEIEKCFFSMNEGLRRRFTFRYEIDTYTPTELLEIFAFKVNQDGWGLEMEVSKNDTDEVMALKEKQYIDLETLFIQNYNYLPNFGGDIETLFLNCKIVHGRRVLFMDQHFRKILTISDITNGFDKIIQSRNYNNMDSDVHEYNDITFY